MTHSFRHGLVIGKFYPPHGGHEYLIRCAASQCDRVSVIVMAADAERIALALRVRWLTEILADQRHVVVTGVTDNDVVDFDSESAWRAHVAHMRRGLILADAARAAPAPAVDAVFTSERYGDELARHFAAASVCVDQARARYPISGTAFRANPAGRWFDVAPCVREHLCRRVAIVGAESTGKTTLAGAVERPSAPAAAPFRAHATWRSSGASTPSASSSEHARNGLPSRWSRPVELRGFRGDRARSDRARECRRGVSGPLLICDTMPLRPRSGMSATWKALHAPYRPSPLPPRRAWAIC